MGSIAGPLESYFITQKLLFLADGGDLMTRMTSGSYAISGSDVPSSLRQSRNAPQKPPRVPPQG